MASKDVVQPECETRQILYSRFLADVRVYIDAMNRLDPSAGREEFDHLYEFADRSHKAFEAARDRLRLHCAAHRCELPGKEIAAKT